MRENFPTRRSRTTQVLVAPSASSDFCSDEEDVCPETVSLLSCTSIDTSSFFRPGSSKVAVRVLSAFSWRSSLQSRIVRISFLRIEWCRLYVPRPKGASY